MALIEAKSIHLNCTDDRQLPTGATFARLSDPGFIRFLKLFKFFADLSSCGRPFQIRGPIDIKPLARNVV